MRYPIPAVLLDLNLWVSLFYFYLIESLVVVIEGEIDEIVFQLLDSGEQLHAHVLAFRFALKTKTNR